jgi:hypothetical protein
MSRERKAEVPIQATATSINHVDTVDSREKP